MRIAVERSLRKTAHLLILALGFSLVACSQDSGDSNSEHSGNRIDDTEGAIQTPGSSFIVGGSIDNDYYYPWVVDLPGCGGVLIAPRWVLTAAHCVTPGLSSNRVSYSRTDIYSGTEVTDIRSPKGAAGNPNPGVTIHPDYTGTDPLVLNDIALVELSSALLPDPYIQTVALPSSPRVPGTVGTYVSVSHDQTLEDGEIAVFRAPIPVEDSDKLFSILATDASATGAGGDSGSGFVTIEGGRAVVRGVVSSGTPLAEGESPRGRTNFTDVATFRPWIISVMGEDAKTLEGNTRVRRSGANARGVVGIGCGDPDGTFWAPLDVNGVELRSNCDDDSRQAVVCAIQGELPAGPFAAANVRSVRNLKITTREANGSVSNEIVQPTSANVVTNHGQALDGATRFYECDIKSPFFQEAPTSGVVIEN